MSFNQDNGKSWFVPGRIEDGDSLVKQKNEIYTAYQSSEFDDKGRPRAGNFSANWPLWSNKSDDESSLGIYEPDPSRRNTNYYLEPKFSADEVIFTTFKDTDLKFYDEEGNDDLEEAQPLGLQVEQWIFTWADERHKDIVIIYYDIINFSEDTLMDCRFGYYCDIDIARKQYRESGATNDYVNFSRMEGGRKMMYGWSGTDQGEEGRNFGYTGVSYVYTPSIDENSYLAEEDDQDEPSENSLRIATLQHWNVIQDYLVDFFKYDFISSGEIDYGWGPFDLKSLLGTQSFNMLPGDTAGFAVMHNFAMPAVGPDPFGSEEDIAYLKEEYYKGIDLFYNKLLKSIRDRQVYARYNNSLFLYPNPADDHLTIEFSTEYDNGCEIKIFDINGNTVFIEERMLSRGENQMQITNPDLPSGTYILTISTYGGVFSRKFTVVR